MTEMNNAALASVLFPAIVLAPWIGAGVLVVTRRTHALAMTGGSIRMAFNAPRNAGPR